jgi:dephospho-CoA kinase
MDIPRVLFIGGAPGTGKSSVALKLSSILDRPVISTDDLGEAVRALVPVEENPNLHASFRSDYINYHTNFSVENQIEDSFTSHKALWPAIDAVADRHVTWDCPAIIEGWALLPELVQKNYPNSGVWISTPSHIIIDRLKAEPSYYENAGDSQRFLLNVAERNEGFAFRLQSICMALQLPFIELHSESLDDVVEIVVSQFSNKGAV